MVDAKDAAPGHHGSEAQVPAAELRPGDLVVVSAGELIPADGEILHGLATINESAVTGESAPVLREAGTDRSGVIGGTKVLSDEIVVRVTVEPGHSFLDRMIALVEGANRQKTPNEIALTMLLAAMTLTFLIVCATLPAIGAFVGVKLAEFAEIPVFGFFRTLIAAIVGAMERGKKCLRDGNMKLDKSGTVSTGYAGMMYVAAILWMLLLFFSGWAL